MKATGSSETLTPTYQTAGCHCSQDHDPNVPPSLMLLLIPLNSLCQSWYFFKSSVFQDIRPCSVLEASRCFGGICCLHLHGFRVDQARNLRHAYPKRQLTSNRLHGVIFQKILLFTTTVVGASNPTSDFLLDLGFSRQSLWSWVIFWNLTPCSLRKWAGIAQSV
jgi:hypothetical protein